MDQPGEDKNQLLEFNDDKSFVKQLLITDQAKKSFTKPTITAEATGLHSSLINNVKKFLDDAKQQTESESTNPMETQDQAVEFDEGEQDSKDEIGVEFDLLMYEDDSDSTSSEDEDE